MAYAEETKVPLEKSIAEAVALLRKHGAARIAQYEEPDSFQIQFEMQDRQVRFKIGLVTEWKGPVSGRNGHAINVKAKIEQHNRQRGRALLLVIKAKLESIESGVETFEQSFLAQIVTANGRTVHERIEDQISDEYRSGAVTALLPHLRS